MLVTTVAIMAVVAFAVIGWKAVRGDSDPSGSSGSGWNELALVNRTSGEVVILDDGGELVREIVGNGRVSDVFSIGDRLALVGPTQIVLEGGDETQTIPIERTDTVTPVRTAGTLHLVVGKPNGGNVVIVDVATGETLDIGALASQAQPQIFANPLLFAETLRVSADATSFAIADASSFQTIVVRQGSEDVSFFGSQPVALSDDRVATSQIIGGQADVELLDYDRDSKARVPTEIPAGGLMIDDDLLMVGIDGGVYRVGDGQSEAERIGKIAVPSGATVASIQPTFDGERLVVDGTVFAAVIDLDGETLFTTTFPSPVDVDTPFPSWTCLPVGGDEAFHSLISLETGDQLADLTGLAVSGAASDGCTVIGERADATEVVAADGHTSLGAVRAATIGPDGRTVVRTTITGTTEILRIDDDFEIGETIDISDLAPIGRDDRLPGLVGLVASEQDLTPQRPEADVEEEPERGRIARRHLSEDQLGLRERGQPTEHQLAPGAATGGPVGQFDRQLGPTHEAVPDGDHAPFVAQDDHVATVVDRTPDPRVLVVSCGSRQGRRGRPAAAHQHDVMRADLGVAGERDDQPW